MKHFIVDITFTVPFEKVEPVVAAHREHLQQGYDAGILLFSGPKIPRIGGILVARAESEEVLEAFCKRDPYRVQQVAKYTFQEFNPVKRQSILEQWVEGK